MSHSQSCSTIAGSCSRTVRRISGPAAGSLRSSESSYPVPARRRASRPATGCDRAADCAGGHAIGRFLRRTLLDHAVVIEHRHPVGGQPDVALEAGRAEAKCQLERLDRVLRRVRASAAVGERDRWIEQ